MFLLCILGSFLKVNVQNENIFAWQKFQILFWVLDIPDIFGGKRWMLGPILRIKKKGPPHTHSGSQSMKRSC